MILNDILFELRRIANVLEKQANVSSFPVEMQTKKAEIPSMFSSDIETAQAEEHEPWIRETMKDLEEAKESGYFFPEDALSEEQLERL